MSSPYLDGVIPIAVMPFDENDQVDLKALKNEIDFLVSIGIKWVGFGFGSGFTCVIGLLGLVNFDLYGCFVFF